MNRYTFFLIILASSTVMHGQQPPPQEHVIREMNAQLALLRNELARPLAQRNAQGQQAPATPPNPLQVEAKKIRLQGAPLDQLSNKIFEAREDGVHMMRLTQEVIGQVATATATAHESALQERLINKSVTLDQARLQREEAEGHLGSLQEIKQFQEQQGKKIADFQNACKDLKFLKEMKALDEKMDQLSHHLNNINFELTREILAAQKILRELKQ